LFSGPAAACSFRPKRRPSLPATAFVGVFVLFSWVNALLRQAVL
jgi:hypothetical protein